MSSDDIFTIEDIRPFLEVFTVAFIWSDTEPFTGRLVSGRVDGPNGEVLCCEEGNIRDLNLKPLPLRRFDFPLDPKLDFKLNLFLNKDDTSVGKDGNSPICFRWNPQNPAYESLVNLVVDHTDGYKKGRAIVTYSALPEGILIKVDRIKFTGQLNPTTTTVYGDIFAFHDYSLSAKRILFQTTAQNPITLNADGSIPLERSRFAVPLDSIFHVVVRLYHKLGPEADVELTKAMFNIDININSKSKMLVVDNGVEISIQMVKNGFSGPNSSSQNQQALLLDNIEPVLALNNDGPAPAQ